MRKPTFLIERYLILLILLLLAGSSVMAVPVSPGRDSRKPNGPDAQRNAILRKAALATVRIIGGEVDSAGEFQGRNSGSGVIISARGLIITTDHVITNKAGRPFGHLWAGLVDPQNEFVPPNRAVQLKVIARDASLDLALLQIVVRRKSPLDAFPHLALGVSDDLSYGDALTVVGFPTAGGPTTTAVRAGVVGIDESQGWIKVEGSVMQGVSGGAVINERGELVGIPTRVQADQSVPFFDDDDAPVGLVTLGAVGFIRSIESISDFLSRVANGAGLNPPGNPLVQIRGLLVEKGTRQPISGGIVAVLSPNTATPQGIVEQHELLAYGKTEFKGNFLINRRLRPGRYIFKVIHPNFQTLIREFVVSESSADLEIELIR